MAICRGANGIAILATWLLTCIGLSQLVVAWVVDLPRQRQHRVVSRLGRQTASAVCFSSARENPIRSQEGTGTTDSNRDGTTTVESESWDDQVIRWVDGILEQKSEQSPFPVESLDDDDGDDGVVTPYEWIVSPNSNSSKDGKKIALRTTGTTPLLDAESIATIRGAAQNLWEQRLEQSPNASAAGAGSAPAPSSRFTLQFADTNSECHLAELVASDPSGRLKTIVDDLLTNKVYPLVRSAFGESKNSKNHNSHHHLTDGSLCVYDSLVVRYNGDKATDRFGASQPLHGDGGVVSVNIALNSHGDDDSEQQAQQLRDTFSGGGTFFEDLIRLDDDDTNNHGSGPILRPSSTGHALAHWSTHRHAGAPTRSGTRDILVIFLAQRRSKTITNTNPQQQQKDYPHHAIFNGIERSFQLKLKARELPGEQRDMALRCLDLAIDKSPFDAQSHFWKAFYLMRGGPPKSRAAATTKDSNPVADEQQQQRWEELQRSVYHLERAMNCAPFDAKINCYAGMAYRQRWMFAQKQQHPGLLDISEDLDRAASCLKRALLLHEKYRKYGISSDFEDNATTAKLTLGEVYVQQERYKTAIEYLSSIGNNSSSDESTDSSLSEAMKQHISKLIAHCHQQQQRGEQDELEIELEPKPSAVGMANQP